MNHSGKYFMAANEPWARKTGGQIFGKVEKVREVSELEDYLDA